MEHKLNKTDATNTTLLLFPAIGLEKNEVEQNGFINAYLRDKDREEQSDNILIYALFKPKDAGRFKRFLERLDEQGLIYTDYDYEDNHVVAVFIFPKKYENDYKLIMLGKYSKVSDEYKSLFKETVERGQPPEMFISLQHHIFNRTREMQQYIADTYNVRLSELHDAECWEIIDLEKELLDVDKILINNKV